MSDCDCVDGWGRLSSHRPECLLEELEGQYDSISNTVDNCITRLEEHYPSIQGDREKQLFELVSMAVAEVDVCTESLEELFPEQAGLPLALLVGYAKGQIEMYRILKNNE